jgi:3-hydroxyisobutyrate dehydrogenase-like beta-hydroxyacid dehydrogenase
VSDELGFIGLGRMGTAMAGRLLDAGRSLTVYNRSPEKTDGLVERGATRADSPASVAARSALVISMVADDRIRHLQRVVEQPLDRHRILPVGPERRSTAPV